MTNEAADQEAQALEPLIPPCKAPLLLDGQPLHEPLQWYMRPRRPYSRRELLADRIVNFTGVVIAWVGAPVLWLQTWWYGDSLIKQMGFWAMGIGMITMLSCSAYYHYHSWNWKRVRSLYSLDHIGISAMIMGSYAPLMIQCGCYKVLAFVWILGAIGLSTEIYRLLQTVEENELCGRVGQWTPMDWANLVRYLLMGWAILPALPSVMGAFPNLALGLIVAGGLLYTGGIPFLIASGLEFHTAIWHSFVLVASICFYLPNVLVLAGGPPPLSVPI